MLVFLNGQSAMRVLSLFLALQTGYVMVAREAEPLFSCALFVSLFTEALLVARLASVPLPPSLTCRVLPSINDLWMATTYARLSCASSARRECPHRVWLVGHEPGLLLPLHFECLRLSSHRLL